MTMTIPADRLRFSPINLRVDGLRTAWLAYRERRATRTALRHAGRLGPRLMADMGIDAETVRAVADGWDGLRPNGMLVRR